MGPDGRARQRLLDEARTAHREHRYDAAYQALHSAGGGEPLPPDDQHLLADAAWWLGLVHECLRLTEQLHHRYVEDGNVDRAGAQALDLAGLLAMRGEYALASGWMVRARRLLEDRPVGFAHGLLAYVDISEALGQGRLDDARRMAADMHQLGERLGDDTISALALMSRGLVEVRHGNLATGFDLLDEAMLPVVGGEVTAEWAGHIYCTITSTCFDVADLARARHWSGMANRWLEGFPDAVMFDGVCRAHRIHLLMLDGAWAAAETEARHVSRQLRELNVEAVAEAEYLCGEVHRVCGRHDEAAAAYARCAAHGREPQPGEAMLRLARGDLDGAWTAVTDAVSRSSDDPFRCTRLLRAQVEIGCATGHAESAAAGAHRLREVADQFRTPGFSAWAHDADGQVHLEAGEDAAASAALALAAAGYRALGAWYDLAATEARIALVCRRLGAADLARVHQDAAAAGFDRLQVPPPAVLPTVPAPRPGGLTSRELEVLAQVARGASNREAAGALSISEATLRRHLANIYLKLDVGSRTAAAAWAHEQGLVAR